jgi:hypothetical protein
MLLVKFINTPTPSAAPSMAGASTAGGAEQLNAADVLIHPRLKIRFFDL